MRRFAVSIALATLATASIFIGCASAADGNQCEGTTFYGGTPVVQNAAAIWRMEVREDESAYRGPSIHDRLNHHWSQTAKRTYRWTSTTMPIDSGSSTELMAISAAVIAESVPHLERGDIVDVYAVLQGIDYSKGRAPIILRRVCAARDEVCLEALRKTQEGRESGVEVGGGYSVAGNRNLSPPPENLGSALLKDGCQRAMAAASH